MTGLGPKIFAFFVHEDAFFRCEDGFFRSEDGFFVREDGAVTVDWVVLTAAIVGLAIMVITPVATETESMTANTADYIDGIDVGFMSQ